VVHRFRCFVGPGRSLHCVLVVPLSSGSIRSCHGHPFCPVKKLVPCVRSSEGLCRLMLVPIPFCRESVSDDGLGVPCD
jgi:hypothetical protein